MDIKKRISFLKNKIKTNDDISLKSELKDLEEICFLRSEIKKHNEKYYFEDNPEIEDYEYDSLKRRLENLEKKYLEYKSDNSPLNCIGSKPSSKFSPVHHDVKMESLHDSFSIEEIEKFYNKISIQFPDSNFTVEPKIDGISISVEYKNGHIFRASTRGDGITGEDITENALTIKNLPHTIDTNVEYLEVRGECFMSKETFLNLVKLQESEGKKSFKNPRNAAAGSIRQKNSEICKGRNLQILFFNVQRTSNNMFKTHSESLSFLKELKLPVVDFQVCSDLNQINKKIDSINKYRKEIPYQIDGAVIKIDDLNSRKILGSTSSYPRWAEAFKYPPEVKKTQCKKIEISVGRSGILTPICVFEPINIGGAYISKASLHNEEFIRKKDIRENDFVYVIKAGDIIPEISKSEINPLIPRHEKFKMPMKCPFCSKKVNIEEGKEGKTYRCINPNCCEILKSKIIHFTSKDAMDVDGFGEETFEILKNELKSYIDIYKLNENILKKYDFFRNKKISNTQSLFEGFNEKIYINKLGKNLLESIEKSKENSLERLLYGLGIPYVGKETANLIASYFKDLNVISECDADEISLIDGVGVNTSKSIVEFFNNNKELIENIKKIGLNTKYKEKNQETFSQICCITGKFNSYTRNEIINKLKEKNIKVSSSVSSKTSFLICGKNPGSKLIKAEKFKIKIIFEKDLNELL